MNQIVQSNFKFYLPNYSSETSTNWRWIKHHCDYHSKKNRSCLSVAPVIGQVTQVQVCIPPVSATVQVPHTCRSIGCNPRSELFRTSSKTNSVRLDVKTITHRSNIKITLTTELVFEFRGPPLLVELKDWGYLLFEQRMSSILLGLFRLLFL